MATEEAEVAALDRVLTRTVLTKDEDLQQVCVVGSIWASSFGSVGAPRGQHQGVHGRYG